MNQPARSIQTPQDDPNAGNQAVWHRIAASRRLAPARGGTEVSFQALGSSCRVWLAAPAAKANPAAEAAVQWVAKFESRYSRFISTSLLNRINAAAGREWVEIDPETE